MLTAIWLCLFIFELFELKELRENSTTDKYFFTTSVKFTGFCNNISDFLLNFFKYYIVNIHIKMFLRLYSIQIY